tara:strand:- start:178 stop:507 length:330 start_codon:yes stop_codon:yes gene_type:complete
VPLYSGDDDSVKLVAGPSTKRPRRRHTNWNVSCPPGWAPVSADDADADDSSDDDSQQAPRPAPRVRGKSSKKLPSKRKRAATKAAAKERQAFTTRVVEKWSGTSADEFQ